MKKQIIDNSLFQYKKELRKLSLLRKNKNKNKNKSNLNKKDKKCSNKYHQYLKSDEWANLKIDLFNNRGKICEKCLSKENINVHHLTYKNIFMEEPEDLMILCRSCHKSEHGL